MKLTMIFNKKRLLKRLSVAILVFVTFAFLKIYVNKFQDVNFYPASATFKNVTVVEGTKKLDIVSPPFVYLTQTEQCLPSKLAQNLQLNVSSKCRCDVIVLSYERECQEESPSHYTYLFDNTTTWGSGRNKLFFHAIERRLDYIYYIFLDDDISLKFNGRASPAMKRLSPIQVFQEWLLDYEPAVGLVDYELKREGQIVLQRRRTLCNRYRLAKNASLANPTIFFDPVLNAFHVKAVSHIFPLDTRHEKVNWWLTDKYITSVVELKFRGQALLFFPVSVENLLHRPYPQSMYGTTQAWRGFIKDIQKQVPAAQYANSSVLFKKFKRNPQHYVATSRTYCMNVIRHQDIVPFAHFEREFSANYRVF